MTSWRETQVFIVSFWEIVLLSWFSKTPMWRVMNSHHIWPGGCCYQNVHFPAQVKRTAEPNVKNKSQPLNRLPCWVGCFSGCSRRHAGLTAHLVKIFLFSGQCQYFKCRIKTGGRLQERLLRMPVHYSTVTAVWWFLWGVHKTRAAGRYGWVFSSKCHQRM